jgi:hypothetical protein
LCDDGAAAGTKISLEMTPFSSTPDLESVMAIVKGAGHSNGGLMLDLWPPLDRQLDIGKRMQSHGCSDPQHGPVR